MSVARPPVCPLPNLLSVCHPTLVCLLPYSRLDGFTHDPSQSPSLDGPAPPPSNREAVATSPAPMLAAGTVVLFPSPWFCGFCPCVALPLWLDIFMTPPLMQRGGSWLRLWHFLPTRAIRSFTTGFGGLSLDPGCGFTNRPCRLFAGPHRFFGVGASGGSLCSFAHQLGDDFYGSVPCISPFGEPSTRFRRSLGGVGPWFQAQCWLSYGGCWGQCARRLLQPWGVQASLVLGP